MKLRALRLLLWVTIALALGFLVVFSARTYYQLEIESAAKAVLEAALKGQSYETLEANLLKLGKRADDVKDDLKFEQHFPSEATSVFTLKGHLAVQVYQVSNVVQQLEIRKVEFK